MKIPYCEKCNQWHNETLTVKNPPGLKSGFKLKGREMVKLCFSCVKFYAIGMLDFNGYWHKIIYPHQHMEISKGRNKH